MPQGQRSAAPERLDGLRVLVVEDETIVAMMVEDMLAELGCAVVGPAGQLAKALDLATNAPLDAAVLDVNLGQSEVYPVAEALVARGLPFVFVTGYGDGGIRAPWNDYPAVQKPFRTAALRQGLLEALSMGE